MDNEARVEEVKEAIARILLDVAIHFEHGDEEAMYSGIKQILSLKNENGKPMLGIIHPDQSLPQNPHSDERTLHIKYNQGLRSGFISGQKSLLASNFVRIIKVDE